MANDDETARKIMRDAVRTLTLRVGAERKLQAAITAALAAARCEEREACAEIADNFPGPTYLDAEADGIEASTAKSISSAIRAHLPTQDGLASASAPATTPSD